ncbi:ATP-binding protein [Actinomadura parmotrematis]|uniref:LuxR C-terminal-related transcriptional regulator n=1 Tax=Actinomadura parmotrematis TaxID=2864039 RepID=A0ABS7FPH5_9ACTN|nr:LuxR family transcriptional regulator [Actinomadura parmotrematis]MBW8482300.1 LuxR C-terminal-related transcriptional regulator [Actinomadura parmotrematis]
MELLERAGFLDALRACPTGRVVLVSGEAGIGKTALVRAFCEQDGRRALWGACDALSTPRPLGPLHDIARAAGGGLAAAMAAESSRHELFTAFLDRLTRPAIAVVEDAHWADEATLDLLVFAGRRMAGTNGLLVVTYRDDEVGPGHPLLAVLGALATDRTVLRIALPPLSVEGVAALAGGGGPAAERLHARTGGNPFFVTEALADPGRAVPGTVRDAVLARAAALGADARAALDAIAVFPGHALLPLVQAAPEAVDACVGAGVVVREGGRVRFRHELARLAVEDAVPPARRAALHARALADLARRGADPARLAHHAEEAGDVAAVLVHAPAAAERAFAVSANRQAADHLRRALDHADLLDARDRAGLLERYAEACTRLDRDDRALDLSREALECWRAAGEPDRAAALLARTAHFLWLTGDSAAARAAVAEALDLARSLPPGPALAAAFTWSAFLLMYAREIPAAIETGERAVDLAERFGDRALLARALNAVGSALWFHEPDRAEGHLTRAVEIALRVGDEVGAASALSNLGSGAGEIRRYAVAERWLREAIDWCTVRDLDRNRRYSSAWLARCLFERGEWDEAVTVLEQTELEGAAPARIVALTVLGRLRVRRGEPGAAEPLEEAWRLAVRTGDLQRLWPAAAGRAELARFEGRPTGPLVRDTYELAVRLRHGWAIGELEQFLDDAPARAHEDAAEPYRLDPVAGARVWEKLGCPYEAAMSLSRSEAHLREALGIFERLGARPAADMASRRMRERGLRAPRRATLAHPHGLTEREADVLALLREGLRNAEIAERLHISEKTAGHHVSSILAKLGVRTRREAARLE